MANSQQFNIPTVRGGHVDHVLTNLSVAYMQDTDQFVAPNVFPVVPVQNASDIYFEYPRGYFWRDEMGPRPISGAPRQVGYKVVTKRYTIEEHALEAMLDDRERANATDPHNPERSKVQLLTSQAMIHRDIRWRNSYFRTGVWSHDINGVDSGNDYDNNTMLQWDETDSDPIQDIDVMRDRVMESTGREPNVLVLGRKVYRRLKNHGDIRDRYKYTQGGQLTRDILASIFEVDRVVIPGGIVNTGPEYEDPEHEDSLDTEFIFPSNNALLVYSTPSPGLDTPTGGYIFSWTGLLGNAALDAGIWRGRDERSYSDWFHIRVAYDMKIVGADFGVFFNGAVK